MLFGGNKMEKVRLLSIVILMGFADCQGQENATVAQNTTETAVQNLTSPVVPDLVANGTTVSASFAPATQLAQTPLTSFQPVNVQNPPPGFSPPQTFFSPQSFPVFSPSVFLQPQMPLNFQGYNFPPVFQQQPLPSFTPQPQQPPVSQIAQPPQFFPPQPFPPQPLPPQLPLAVFPQNVPQVGQPQGSPPVQIPAAVSTNLPPITQQLPPMSPPSSPISLPSQTPPPQIGQPTPPFPPQGSPPGQIPPALSTNLPPITQQLPPVSPPTSQPAQNQQPPASPVPQNNLPPITQQLPQMQAAPFQSSPPPVAPSFPNNQPQLFLLPPTFAPAVLPFPAAPQFSQQNSPNVQSLSPPQNSNLPAAPLSSPQLAGQPVGQQVFPQMVTNGGCNSLPFAIPAQAPQGCQPVPNLPLQAPPSCQSQPQPPCQCPPPQQPMTFSSIPPPVVPSNQPLSYSQPPPPIIDPLGPLGSVGFGDPAPGTLFTPNLNGAPPATNNQIQQFQGYVTQLSQNSGGGANSSPTPVNGRRR